MKYNKIQEILNQHSVSNSKELAKLLLEHLGLKELNYFNYGQNSNLIKSKINDTSKKGIFETDIDDSQYKAAYDIEIKYDPIPAEERFVLPRLFVLKQYNRNNVIWLNKLSQNYEDAPLINFNRPLGFDFISTPDRFLFVISNEDNFKVLELNYECNLNSTQIEILDNIKNVFEYKDKKGIHNHLWKSLSLESVNNKFYKDIIQSFNLLRNHLVAKKLHNDNAVIFTNRLIGRILFCYFLMKKRFISSEYFRMNNLDDNSFYNEVLSKLFFSVLNTPKENRLYHDKESPYLNGGLFESRESDSYDISFPSSFFNQLLTTLADYNWTVDESLSNYEVIAIDPEMLGRIFENLLAEINDNDGSSENARKAKGAFYTPRYIIDFMCKESLRLYLKDNTSKGCHPTVDSLFNSSIHYYTDQRKNLLDDLKPYKKEIIDALEKVTILDPACGSGAFPMGMLQIMLQLYQILDQNINTSELKIKILKNNIYGVDIEPNAIEISRLRAWLSIIVDIDNIEKVKPLPNLEFKFMCCNSLISLHGDMLNNDEFKQNLNKIRSELSSTDNYTDKRKIENKYLKLIENLPVDTQDNSLTTKPLKTFNPFLRDKASDFYENEIMFGIKNGFDLVIGNPPYVSVKDVQHIKDNLVEEFKFCDDLYNHFYFKGFDLLKHNGILNYITSNSFWTIDTKHDLRKKLLENKIIEIAYTANPFTNVVVDTCIIIVKKHNLKDNVAIKWTNRDTQQKVIHPETLYIDSDLYINSINNVLFEPSKLNLQLYNLLHRPTKIIYDRFKNIIKTSKNIDKAKQLLDKYREEELSPGDITLLGLVTDSGQGLATGDNGTSIGVLEGTKEAEDLLSINGRAKMLYDAVKEYKLSKYSEIKSKKEAYDFLNNKSENEIRHIFDNIKNETKNTKLFGKGKLYKIVSQNELADLDLIGEEEKYNGIDASKTYVPYEKGDKGGNQWYKPTPFYIDWSVENVKRLKDRSSGSRWQGYNFFFREGLCYNNVSKMIKARIKWISINDVGSMSIYCSNTLVTNKYITLLLNSALFTKYVNTFLNATMNFQINDARLLPIIIPTQSQLVQCEDIFNEAYEVQKMRFEGVISNKDADDKLLDIRKKHNEIVNLIYNI